MKDHTSSAAAAARASQEDPIAMYLIVRKSLNMTMGKACAQCAHASQMLQLKFNELEKELSTDKDFLQKISIFREWLDGSFRKIVLQADDKDWEKLKDHFEVGEIVLVIDAGLTQVESGSETCIGIWPMHKSQRPKILQRLQAMK